MHLILGTEKVKIELWKRRQIFELSDEEEDKEIEEGKDATNNKDDDFNVNEINNEVQNIDG